MTEYLSGIAAIFSQLLEARDPAALVVIGIFGLLIGSFLSVIVFRLPVMLFHAAPEGWIKPPEGVERPNADTLSVIAPRSRCAHCDHQLRWYENIPVASYVFLRARCAACKKAISPLYPSIELLSCFAAVIAAIWFGADSRLPVALVLSFALIPIAFIDVRYLIIPDDIVVPMIWLGLLVNAFGLFAPLKDSLFGAVAGYGILWSVYWIHRLISGREGMGYGDFKLAAMLGAWLGIQLLPVVLFLAFAGGAIVGLGLMIAGRATTGSAVPFGPFLVVAGWVSLYWGNWLLDAYWGISWPWSI